MTCPNCNHLNPEGTFFCKECNSFLPDSVVTGVETAADRPKPQPPVKLVKAIPGKPAPIPTAPSPAAPPSAPLLPVASLAAPTGTAPVNSDSPFGDFLPAWINPNEPKPASTRQSRQVASAPAAPISIDALLEETAGPKPISGTGPVMVETVVANPASPSPGPQPNFTFTPPEFITPPDPWQGLPVPAFEKPPLWFKPPAEDAWHEVKKVEEGRAVPSTTMGNGYNPTLVGPETRDPNAAEPVGPEYGIDRGFYFFTDRHGNIIVHALAGFVRRLAGAFVDSIISAILGVIFFYLVVVLFLNLDNRNYTQSVLGVALAAIILPVLFGFLYHTILVGLTSQTVGHRLFGIKVIKRGGRAVGLISGIVRALYGLIPTCAATIIGIVLPSDTSGRNVLGLIVTLIILGLTALGMAWALFDKGHQGLHDKLADTYVVSAKES